MTAEAQYNKAKEEWLDAAKSTGDYMKDSKERHKEEKDGGMTSDSWEEWFPQNDPMFANEWSKFQQKEAAFRMAIKQFDSAKAEAWEKAYKQIYTEKYHGAGEDKGSKHLIITPEA